MPANPTKPSARSAIAPSAAPRWREILSGGRAPLVIGLCMVELLTGLEALIVTAAMPRVVHELGGVAYYGLVFSGYALAGLASIPVGGREVDRHGPARPMIIMGLIFGIGTVAAALSPSMPVLAAARVVQGYGGGGLYTVAYAAVAGAFPARLRPRLLALLAAIWVGAALAGPSLGAFLAVTLSWRWDFFIVLAPLALALGLILPPLLPLSSQAPHKSRLPLRPPIQLATGVGLCMASMSASSWLTPFGVLAGFGLAMPALRHLVPPGSFRAIPGRPGAAAAAFLLNLGFFTADAFVPLLLTGVRGRTLQEAGVAVTLVTVGWAAGAWYQGRSAAAQPAQRLLRLGCAVLAAGMAGMIGALGGMPLVPVYALWTVAGMGMGLAYQTVLLASMDGGPSGDEGSVVAARFVAGRLGISLGTGVGGGCIALASALGLPLETGLGAVFAIAMLATLGCLAIASRVSQPAR